MTQQVWNHAGDLETRIVRPGFVVNLQSEDTLTVLYLDTFERVPFQFFLAPDVVVPAGEYNNDRLSMQLKMNQGRQISGSVSHVRGGFFDGSIRSTSLNVAYRPMPRVHLTSFSLFDRVEVPSGSFDSFLSRLTTSYHFSPELTTRVAGQYSSLFDEFILNARLRWIFTPGSEAWLVYDEGHRFDLMGPSLRDRALVLKIVHNLRF